MHEPDICIEAERTLSAAYVRVLLGYLRSVDVDPIALFGAEAMTRMEAPDPLARLPVSDWARWLDLAEQHCGQPDLVPALSRHFQPWHAGLVGFTLMTSQSVLEMARSLSRFHHLINDVYMASRGMEGTRCYLRLVPASAVSCGSLARLSLCANALIMRWLTGRPDLRFDADFQGLAPHEEEPYRRLLGGQVRFKQGSDTLWADVDYLQLPIVLQDASTHGLLSRQALEQLDALTQGQSTEHKFVSQIEHLTRQRLDGGEATLDMLANDLRIPARTLQRRLDSLDMNFRSLLERVRKAQALVYLNESRLPLAQVAQKLGFANQGTFHRAFKRWTGDSPGAYRRSKNERESDPLRP